jgi:hypothetical protein
MMADAATKRISSMTEMEKRLAEVVGALRQGMRTMPAIRDGVALASVMRPLRRSSKSAFPFRRAP